MSDYSFYDKDTGMCGDGTRDCIYVEKYNNDRILQGIFNNKDEELSKKFLDDVYSGKLQFQDTDIAAFSDNVKFENGTFKMRNSGATTWYTVQVGVRSVAEAHRLAKEENILVLPPSMFLIMIALYFKANNLPKPNVVYELKSDMSMTQFRESAPPPPPPPPPSSQVITPAPTTGYVI